MGSVAVDLAITQVDGARIDVDAAALPTQKESQAPQWGDGALHKLRSDAGDVGTFLARLDRQAHFGIPKKKKKGKGQGKGQAEGAADEGAAMEVEVDVDKAIPIKAFSIMIVLFK